MMISDLIYKHLEYRLAMIKLRDILNDSVSSGYRKLKAKPLPKVGYDDGPFGEPDSYDDFGGSGFKKGKDWAYGPRGKETKIYSDIPAEIDADKEETGYKTVDESGRSGFTQSVAKAMHAKPRGIKYIAVSGDYEILPSTQLKTKSSVRKELKRLKDKQSLGEKIPAKNLKTGKQVYTDVPTDIEFIDIASGNKVS